MSGKAHKSLYGRSIATLAMVLSVWIARPVLATAADDAAAGQQLFQNQCASCHTVGKGDLVGPDLKGVTERRPREWLEQWIAAPDAVLAKKDPYALDLLHKFNDVPMPNLGLGASDVSAVLAYLATTASDAAGGSPAPATEAKSAPGVEGKPDVGKELFTGVVRFHNGGPPCMACHSVTGIGALGGGKLGPDLTEVVKRFRGAAAVDAFLAGTPTPTMKAIWSKNPISADDRANLVSFLAQAAVAERPVQAVWQLGGLAVLGVVVLLSIAAWRWSYRLRFGVRRPMVATPTTGHTDARGGGWFEGPYHGGWQARFSKPGDHQEPRGPANTPRTRR